LPQLLPHPPPTTPFPYTTLFRSSRHATNRADQQNRATSRRRAATADSRREFARATQAPARRRGNSFRCELRKKAHPDIAREPRRSEEHTSELQSRGHLVCRLLLE